MELEEIRKQVIASKWKYCREVSARCFSNYCNTRLKDYLDYLFPDNEFVYDEVIPRDIQLLRGSDKTRRFRPDARCEILA